MTAARAEPIAPNHRPRRKDRGDRPRAEEPLRTDIRLSSGRATRRRSPQPAGKPGLSPSPQWCERQTWPCRALRHTWHVADNSRPSAAQQSEPGIQPIHSFLLRRAAAVYAIFLGFAFSAIFLSVVFISGAVDVGVPRWLWLLDLIVVVGFLVDHFRVAVARGSAPRDPVLGAGLLVAAALVGLTLLVCW